MTRRRSKEIVIAEELIVVTESLPSSEADEATVNDYKKLGDKIDTVITKIKSRKERKK